MVKETVTARGRICRRTGLIRQPRCLPLGEGKTEAHVTKHSLPHPTERRSSDENACYLQTYP